jgi:hypothetical protein
MKIGQSSMGSIERASNGTLIERYPNGAIARIWADMDVALWLVAERNWALDVLASDIVTSDNWGHVETGAELLKHIKMCEGAYQSDTEEHAPDQ